MLSPVRAATVSHQTKQLKRAARSKLFGKASAPASYSNAIYSALMSITSRRFDHLRSWPRMRNYSRVQPPLHSRVEVRAVGIVSVTCRASRIRYNPLVEIIFYRRTLCRNQTLAGLPLSFDFGMGIIHFSSESQGPYIHLLSEQRSARNEEIAGIK